MPTASEWRSAVPCTRLGGCCCSSGKPKWCDEDAASATAAGLFCPPTDADTCMSPGAAPPALALALALLLELPLPVAHMPSAPLEIAFPRPLPPTKAALPAAVQRRPRAEALAGEARDIPPAAAKPTTLCFEVPAPVPVPVPVPVPMPVPVPALSVLVPVPVPVVALGPGAMDADVPVLAAPPVDAAAKAPNCLAGSGDDDDDAENEDEDDDDDEEDEDEEASGALCCGDAVASRTGDAAGGLDGLEAGALPLNGDASAPRLDAKDEDSDEEKDADKADDSS